MIENLLWAVFGVLSALIGVLIVYVKNSQKILNITNSDSKIESFQKKKNEEIM